MRTAARDIDKGAKCYHGAEGSNLMDQDGSAAYRAQGEAGGRVMERGASMAVLLVFETDGNGIGL